MSDEKWMRIALEEAVKAELMGEVPIGAVIVSDKGEILAKGHNVREQTSDPTSHAEIVAIRGAADNVGGWRLEQCTLYSTLEPCPMCSGAILQARVPRVVYGATDPKAGCAGTLMTLLQDNVLEKECKELLTGFFKGLREKKK